jgi:hypothetical protein
MCSSTDRKGHGLSLLNRDKNVYKLTFLEVTGLQILVHKPYRCMPDALDGLPAKLHVK